MDLEAPSDEQLMARLREQDSAALDDLYRRYAQSVYSLSYRILGERTTSEDVLQEVFLKLWRQPDSYDPTRGPLGPWLLSVTHHRSIDVLRRQRVRTQRTASEDWQDFIDPADGTVDPADLAGSQELAATLRKALRQIPEPQRRAIEMAFFQGKTHAEISAELGEPLGTAKTRIRLGMRKLRVLLEAEGIVSPSL